MIRPPLAGPAVSAHRGGSERCGAATLQAYQDALASGAEYAEFDIRRTADGALVVHHDPRAGGPTGPLLHGITHAELCRRAGYAVPLVEEVMALVAGKLVGHLDLKEAGYEHEVIDRAVALLGRDGLVATSLEDRSVAAITRAFPGVRTALSLGRDRREVGTARLAGTRAGELFPLRRLHACGAHGVAVHQLLARAGVLRRAARHRLFTMIWTVNDDAGLRRFLADERVDVLITDRPRRAVQLRAEPAPPPAPH